jgi:hypothetical protein
LQPDPVAQGVVDLLPEPVASPDHEVTIDDPPWRQIVREQPPGDPAANDVEYRVEDGAPGVARRLSKELWSGDQRLD